MTLSTFGRRFVVFAGFTRAARRAKSASPYFRSLIVAAAGMPVTRRPSRSSLRHRAARARATRDVQPANDVPEFASPWVCKLTSDKRHIAALNATARRSAR
jgi:hypothetical protein